MSSLISQVTSTAGRVRDRLTEAVEDRVSTVRARAQAHTAREDSSELAFGHGYLVRDAGMARPREVAGWRTRTLSSYSYHARGRITVSPVSTGGALVLVGRAVDVSTGNVSPQGIADSLAELAAQDTGAMVRSAAYLGGRWCLFLHRPDRSLTVLTDALASQRVFYSPDGRALGSYPSLVPEPTELPANSLLEITAEDGPAVRRYYPWPEAETPGEGTASADPAEAYAEFRKRIVAHTRLLADLGRPGIALTGGFRSQAVLAAYLPHRRDGGYSFTHFATKSARESQEQADDLFTASALSHRLGVPHRVVRAVAPPRDDAFARAYRRSFPGGRSLASAFARHTLPRDTVELHSAGSDVTDLSSWESLDRHYLEGDLAHRVLLPFNDRRLLEIMLSLPPEQRAEAHLVRRLAAELETS